MSLREYFEAEMRRLHEEGQAFAELHPDAARMLNLNELRDRDPYVERLLEGVAFLTAQLRQQIEADVPELSETLLNQMWPDLLRPLPSMTIMELRPVRGQLRQPRELAAGLEFLPRARNADAPDCPFVTSLPVTLNPLEVQSVELEARAEGGSLLRLRLRALEGLPVEALALASLSFHVHAEPGVALWLHDQLVRRCRGIRVVVSDEKGMHREPAGPPLAFRPAHLDGAESVVPLSGRRFGAFHLLQEYFCFRERFLFVTLEGLERYEWPKDCHEFALEILLGDPPPRGHGVGRDSLRLHCVPAVNLVEDDARPVTAGQQRLEWRLLPDAHPARHQFVHSVTAVHGLLRDGSRRVEYAPVSALRHGRPEGAWYALRRRDVGAEAPGVFIELGGAPALERQTLSCRIRRFNGVYPHERFGQGEIGARGRETPSFVEGQNLIRPTRPLYPPAGGADRWALIAHLNFSLAGLDRVEALQGLMSLYDWSDAPLARSRREALLALEQRPLERIRRGIFLRGVRFLLEVDREGFSSEAEVALFGEVLHHFLSQIAPINLAVETCLRLRPNGREMTWMPMIGQRLPM